jgi:hypothetical protein
MLPSNKIVHNRNMGEAFSESSDWYYIVPSKVQI